MNYMLTIYNEEIIDEDQKKPYPTQIADFT